MFRFFTALLVALSTFAAQAAVDVNKASQADLETLRGVGPSLSGKIIEARKAGDFKSWGDLVDRVSGVGPASAAKLSKVGLTVVGLTVAGSAYAADTTSGAAKPKAERGSKAPKTSADKPAKTKSVDQSGR
jgi:competence protein ComEA